MHRLFVASVVGLALALAACNGTHLSTLDAAPDALQAFGSGSDGDYGAPPVSPYGVQPATQPAPVARRPAALVETAVPRPVSRQDFPAPAPVSPYYVDDDGEAPVEYVEDLPVTEPAPGSPPPMTTMPPMPQAGGVWMVYVPGGLPQMMQGAPSGWQAPAPAAYAPPAYAAPTTVYTPAAAPCGAPATTSCGCPNSQESYLQIGVETLPGIGAGFTFGRRLMRNKSLSISGELGFSVQDLWEEYMGEGLRGTFWALKAGVRFDFGNCCSTLRPYVRAGVILFELSQVRTGERDSPVGFEGVTIDLIDFDLPGTNLGAYGSIGFDVRMSKCWTTGPEIGYFIGTNLDEGGAANSSPFVRWNFTYNF